MINEDLLNEYRECVIFLLTQCFETHFVKFFSDVFFFGFDKMLEESKDNSELLETIESSMINFVHYKKEIQRKLQKVEEK